LTAACAVLALGLYVKTPDAPVAFPQQAQQHQVHATDHVDIEQVEQTLEDLDILTPAAQSPTGSM
jgi:hypothetical protein